ncbi:MAG: GNAT family N-acetyltransferase [Salinivirgaceae bacterium]|nr:GNAT family N-acetyltransferase [Salinivirgaceae bacterium]
MLNIDLLEWIGYLASVLILTSMLMSSFLKLRIINMSGAALFSIYGFMIGALPVGILNACIVFANIYHLYNIYKTKDSFNSLEIRRDNRYLVAFIDYYKKDIIKYFPKFQYHDCMNTYTYMILRNMAVAGVFLAREYGDKLLYIGLDYVIPEYRDLKIGKYVYREKIKKFKEDGYERVCTIPQTDSHAKYLEKMGFVKEIINDEDHYVYKL